MIENSESNNKNRESREMSYCAKSLKEEMRVKIWARRSKGSLSISDSSSMGALFFSPPPISFGGWCEREEQENAKSNSTGVAFVLF